MNGAANDRSTRYGKQGVKKQEKLKGSDTKKWKRECRLVERWAKKELRRMRGKPREQPESKRKGHRTRGEYAGNF